MATKYWNHDWGGRLGLRFMKREDFDDIFFNMEMDSEESYMAFSMNS